MSASLSSQDHVLIVGAGFSGTLLAINILRHDGPRVTLVERRPDQLARGVAYSAADASHLLNVRAANMSALPDAADHFARWLGERGLGNGRSFVPRTLYGSYLREMLETALADAGDRLTLMHGETIAIHDGEAGLVAHLSDGRALHVDRAVLALGNLPPHAPPGIDTDKLAADIYCDDPWSADIADGLDAADEVLLLGTGLTAVDAALLLRQRGFAGRITAMSRRGLQPRAHHDAQPPVTLTTEKPARNLSALVRSVRDEAEATGWRGAVDALRPVTQMLWAGAEPDVRARFLRHLRPFWDVHRHRLAPAVAATIDEMVAHGQLRFTAGKLASLVQHGNNAEIRYRPRGQTVVAGRQVRRVINCTGPQGDLLRSREPLLNQLMQAGAIRPDAMRLGIDIDASTRTLSAGGTPHPRLHAIGPMTRGAFWEVVAVPDIRMQSWNVARALANARWVGGEGL